MSDLHPITESDLQAWVDGRLPAARRAEVDAWLAARPDEAARLDAYREQDAELRRLYDPVLLEPVPGSLSAAAHARERHGFRWNRVAAVGWLALGGLLGWQAATLRAPVGSGGTGAPVTAAAPATDLVRQATVAHVTYAPEARHPVEVGADQEAHLAAWLSKRLGGPVKPPSLLAEGFALVGGRLLPGTAEAPAAQFMYEDPRGVRLTLYVTRKAEADDATTAFRSTEQDGLSVFWWMDGDFGYALSGAVDRARMLRIATALHRQIGR